MKTCFYCGQENKEPLTACRECGTNLSLPGHAIASPTLSRRTLKLVVITALAAIVTSAVFMPMLLFLIPVLAIFYAPIYLPFLLSFFIQAHEWRGLRWSLRISSVAACLIWYFGMSNQPQFGNDVGGNLAGASRNFVWVWGSGIACATIAVIIGVVLHAVQSKRT